MLFKHNLKAHQSQLARCEAHLMMGNGSLLHHAERLRAKRLFWKNLIPGSESR